jgi:chromate transporter
MKSQNASDVEIPHEAPVPQLISWSDMWLTWSRVAALSFGGPAGQIAVMHRLLVQEKKWISEDQFLHALNYCMLLPGPEAQQLATYTGWLLRGTWGGLLAGGLFILPGFVSIMIMSLIYALYGQTWIVSALFFGLKPAVIAIVIEAVHRVSHRILKNRVMVWIAILSLIGIHVFSVPFPVIILLAGVLGFMGGHYWPQIFCVIKNKTTPSSADPSADHLTCTPLLHQQGAHSKRNLWRRSVIVSAICLTLWFGPLWAIRVYLGENSVYYQEGLFFSQAAMVTFGGAYAVLAYIGQAAVETHHWIEHVEMLDGLGMAETTPGPLIMVLQFVGFMGAYRQPTPFSPVIGGILGAVITVWVTFVPCFYWIFLGAPFVERLKENKRLNSAFSAITAAVVGVMTNLAIWLMLKTLFREVNIMSWHGARWLAPVPDSLDLRAVAVMTLACLLTFYWKKGLFTTLGVSTLFGIVLFFAST